MFIDAKANCKGTGDLKCLDTKDYTIYWRGFIYASGVPSGQACIRKLSADLKNQTLQDIAPRLRGSFLLVVHFKVSGEYGVLVDNSGLFHAFYSDRGVSTSFLEIAALHGITDLDAETVVEFLHCGFVSFDRTLSSHIRKLPPEQITYISPAAGIRLVPKSLVHFESAPTETLEELLRDFVSCISQERVSVDLTGGMDTRVLAILLGYFGLDFEVAIRGNDADIDVQIATEVAGALGKELHICRPRIDNLEGGIGDAFEICDGLLNAVSTFGALQLQRERAARGITLMLSGAGGELFRDHFWLQDFPFYSQKKAHVERFCSLRLLPTDPDHSYLAGQFREVSRGYRQHFLEDLLRYEVRGNTQTYDRIIYRVRYRELIGRFVTNHTHVLQCYAPFMEYDAVNYGYHLPRFTRFFDYYFRKLATKYNPEAALIQTTRGRVSLSAQTSALVSDAYRYCNDKLTRVGRRIGQKYLNRRYRSCGKLDEPVGHPGLFSTLRRSGMVEVAMARLKDGGILNPALRVDDLKDQYLGTALTLAMVVDRLGGWPIHSSASEPDWELAKRGTPRSVQSAA
jgi:hypothetical protein